MEESGLPRVEDGLLLESLPANRQCGLEEEMWRILSKGGLKDGFGGFRRRIKCWNEESILLAGTVDYNVQKVYNELPQWGESFSQARARYQQTIKELADKYPTENLLFLTHGEALQTALSSTRKDGVNAKLQYCAYVELRRPIFNKRR
ncbi:hypothetical protein QL285_062901 [Trifolium repens]|nr:hypothetical protein QL285_062901 [Trifolium repens]